MKRNFPPIIFVLAMICQSLHAQNYATVRVVFPFEVSNVQLLSWWPEQTVFLTATGQREYEGQVTLQSGSLICSIKYNINGFSGDYWVAGGKKYAGNLIPNRLDVHGIKCARVFVNNQLLSNLYTIRNWGGDGADIAFQLNSFGGIVPFNDASHPHIPTDDRIPSEVHHHHAYRDNEVPYSYDNDIAGWIVALSDNNFLESSKVEIDFIRVYGLIGINQILLCEQNYNSYDPMNDGGLYLRYPFFPKGYDQHDPLPGNVSAGILTINTSDYRTRSPHLWSNHHFATNWSIYSGYRLHCRARITGHALIQGGIDFKDAANNIHELGVSDWYFHGNGQWQDVIFDTRTFLTNNTITGKLLFYNDIESEIPQAVTSDFYVQLYDNGNPVASPQIVQHGNPFSFDNLENGKQYNLRLWEQTDNQLLSNSWGWNNWGGVTALDALIISYMTIESNITESFPWIVPVPGQGITPFAFKNADVNSSNTLSSLDALTVLYRTINYPGTSPFPGGKPNFIATAKKQPSLTSTTYPYAPDILFNAYGNYQSNTFSNQVYQQATLPPVSLGLNVVNVFLSATGDINASKGLATKMKNPAQITYRNTRKVEEQEVIDLNFYLDGNPTLAAFNLNLNYNPDQLEIVSVNDCKVFRNDVEKARLSVAWMDTEGKTFTKDIPVLKLSIRLKNKINENDHLFSIADGTCWADTKAMELHNIHLITDKVEIAGSLNDEIKTKFMFSNYPNPFTNSSFLNFIIDEPSNIELTISNALGVTVQNQNYSEHLAGTVLLEINRKMLHENGIYNYMLKIKNHTDEHIIQGKIVLID